MDIKQLIDKLIRDEKLITPIKQNILTYKNIIKKSLNINSNEKFIIIADLGYKNYRIPLIMGVSYAIAAEELNLDYELIVERPRDNIKEKADQKIINTFYDAKEGSVFAIALSHKLGSLGRLGKSYRKLMKQHNHRFVSTPGLSQLHNNYYHYLINSLNVDYKKIDKLARILKFKLDNTKKISILKEDNILEIDVSGYKAIINSGIYYNPGSGGNLPAGEVYLPIKDANGKIIVDGSIKTLKDTLLLEHKLIKPKVILELKNNTLINIKGREEAHVLIHNLELAQHLCKNKKSKAYVMQLAEFGIGINPHARVIGPTIINEKSQNTCHIAFGSNYWFGGNKKTRIHLDQVILNPEIYLDGRYLNLNKIFRLY